MKAKEEELDNLILNTGKFQVIYLRKQINNFFIVNIMGCIFLITLNFYNFSKNVLVNKTELLSKLKYKTVAQSFNILWGEFQAYKFYRLHEFKFSSKKNYD